MIYKVRIENKIDVAMTVTHDFETVVQDTEEAEQFGREASGIALAFNVGFAAGESEVDE
jgi:hypothetical protein